MTKILLATTNRGKLAEMLALLAGMPVEIVLPADLGLTLNVQEDGQTYAENAVKKAAAYANASGLLALADDSGLEVDALGGAPGLHSARYLPQPGATDADRRLYLLQQLAGLPRPWRAHFHCTAAVAKPGQAPLTAEGRCDGEIIPTERGTQGFGYDPIFLVDGLDQTMAELSMAHKNTLSHRARAVLAARPLILRLLAE